MRKIKSIELNLPMKEEFYVVGDNIRITLHKKGTVTEIIDKSIEFENSIDLIYYIYVDEMLYKAIENSPVTITYFLEGTE